MSKKSGPKISVDKEVAAVRNLTKEFKEFISRGNVVDLAVGVIIGDAFGKIVSSLVGNIFMPILNANLTACMRVKVPVELQGRVFSARDTIQLWTMPVGLFLGGAMVTCLAALTALWFGHRVLGRPMGMLTGMLAGLQTQPAVLAFAQARRKDDLPNIGYATVYPVATIAKIIIVQLIYSLVS